MKCNFCGILQAVTWSPVS